MALFEPVEKVIKDLCLRSGDRLQQNKMLFMNVAADTWQDLNETTLKIAKRVKIPVRRICKVDKKMNTVDIPTDKLRLCSVNLIDDCGVFYPIYRNDNDRLHEDIVDIGAAKNCACEHNCGYQLCNTLKGYEAVVSIKSDFLPNATPVSFQCTDRKVVLGGILYKQEQKPLRVYVSNVWVDTVLQTTNTEMCALETDGNGCVCDSERNINNVCDACFGKSSFDNGIPVGGNAECPPQQGQDTWIYYCNSKLDWFSVQCGGYPRGFRRECRNTYNLNEFGNRILLPKDLGYSHVMVRYYEDISLKNLQIPYIAKETFMTGLQYFSTTNHDKKQQLSAVYGQKYSRQKWGLFLELNKYRISELKMILTPPIYVPSYESIREYYGRGLHEYETSAIHGSNTARIFKHR